MTSIYYLSNSNSSGDCGPTALGLCLLLTTTCSYSISESELAPGVLKQHLLIRKPATIEQTQMPSKLNTLMSTINSIRFLATALSYRALLSADIGGGGLPRIFSTAFLQLVTHESVLY
jgi:hypothetical protein